MKSTNSYIIDHSPRWQIGYCVSFTHSGKYHLMLTDRVHLFNTERSPYESSTRTLGYYAKREIVTIVPFMLEQSTDTLQTMWTNGQ